MKNISQFTFPRTKDIIIYAAGKTWQAGIFRSMRDDYGFNINGRWIDADEILTSPEDKHIPEHHEEKHKRRLWEEGCKLDCRTCDTLILYTTPADNGKLNGALVEIGHVTYVDKPAYLLGSCSCIEPQDHSNRAWMAQDCVHYWPEYVNNPLAGFKAAIEHYKANYAEQWKARRFLNNNIPQSVSALH